MEQINTIDKISAVYRNTAEEARQELNKVQQKIYRIGSLRLLLFVAMCRNRYLLDCLISFYLIDK